MRDQLKFIYESSYDHRKINNLFHFEQGWFDFEKVRFFDLSSWRWVQAADEKDAFQHFESSTASTTSQFIDSTRLATRDSLAASDVWWNIFIIENNQIYFKIKEIVCCRVECVQPSRNYSNVHAIKLSIYLSTDGVDHAGDWNINRVRCKLQSRKQTRDANRWAGVHQEIDDDDDLVHDKIFEQVDKLENLSWCVFVLIACRWFVVSRVWKFSVLHVKWMWNVRNMHDKR